MENKQGYGILPDSELLAKINYTPQLRTGSYLSLYILDRKNNGDYYWARFGSLLVAMLKRVTWDELTEQQQQQIMEANLRE